MFQMLAMSKRLAALVATAALAVCGFGGAAALAPQEAEAASSTYTSYCFRHLSGSAWTNRPVYAQAYYYGQWVDIGSSTSNMAGCGAFWMPANTYVRVRAYLRLPNSAFGGATGWALTPRYGGGSINLGMGYVNG